MTEPIFDHERLDPYRMPTRLIQRPETVSEGLIEYEYEYRDAEYEYKYKYKYEPGRIAAS